MKLSTSLLWSAQHLLFFFFDRKLFSQAVYFNWSSSLRKVVSKLSLKTFENLFPFGRGKTNVSFLRLPSVVSFNCSTDAPRERERQVSVARESLKISEHARVSNHRLKRIVSSSRHLTREKLLALVCSTSTRQKVVSVHLVDLIESACLSASNIEADLRKYGNVRGTFFLLRRVTNGVICVVEDLR